MKHVRFIYYSIIAFVSFSTIGCGLEQDVELALPAYNSQPIVEMYLTPGKPFRALLTNSSGFFDPLEIDNDRFLENLLLDSAEVTIRYGDTIVELANFVIPDPTTDLVFNYVSFQSVPYNFVDSFYLDILLANGAHISGATKLLPVVPTDSSVVEYPENLADRSDTLARIFTYLTDPNPDEINRFRRILTYEPRDSTTLQDFVFTDEFNDQPSIPIGTIFFFDPGDTIFLYTAHVDETYEKYLLSVQLAEQSNGNPFAQPSAILSNVSGDANPIGIFTSYAYVKDTVIIPQP